MRDTFLMREQLDGLQQSLGGLASLVDAGLPEMSAEVLVPSALRDAISEVGHDLTDALTDIKAEAVAGLEKLAEEAAAARPLGIGPKASHPPWLEPAHSGSSRGPPDLTRPHLFSR